MKKMARVIRYKAIQFNILQTQVSGQRYLHVLLSSVYRVTYCNGKCEGGWNGGGGGGRGDIIELWWQWCKHARVNLYPYLVFFFPAFSAEKKLHSNFHAIPTNVLQTLLIAQPSGQSKSFILNNYLATTPLVETKVGACAERKLFRISVCWILSSIFFCDL